MCVKMNNYVLGDGNESTLAVVNSIAIDMHWKKNLLPVDIGILGINLGAMSTVRNKAIRLPV